MRRELPRGSLRVPHAAWVHDSREQTRSVKGEGGQRPTPAEAERESDRERADQVALRFQIEHLKRHLLETHRRLRATQVDTVTALAAAVEAKDPFTERHSTNVSRYAERLARTFGLSSRQMATLRTASVLHDIGKIGVPDAVLTKPGSLTPDEFRVIKQHPVTGAAILQSAAWLQRELPLVLHHHEWYDGSGYPAGLRADEIPLGARILQAADSIDAMLSRRSYKRGYTVAQVITELEKGRGKQFDPTVVDVAVSWLRRSPEDVFRCREPERSEAGENAPATP